MFDETQRQAIRSIAKKHGLSLVVLFGSQATGRLHKKSDIDIAVLPRDPAVVSVVVEEIGDAFRRDDVEVADLTVPSPYLWHAVARDGVPLFEATPELFSKWRLRAMTLWYDTAPLRERQRQVLRTWANAQRS